MMRQPFNCFALAATEREFLRLAFHPRFGRSRGLRRASSSASGVPGRGRGNPGFLKPCRGLIARGLVVISPEPPTILGTAAFFTVDGLEAMRWRLRDRRAMDPECCGHLRRQFGFDVRGADVV